MLVESCAGLRVTLLSKPRDCNQNFPDCSIASFSQWERLAGHLADSWLTQSNEETHSIKRNTFIDILSITFADYWTLFPASQFKDCDYWLNILDMFFSW